ncbi:MAG: T9SS type A sorting domain-containing protein [Bacteroidales bacterium]|nr:T9SS type A sorting domain-containing protein [Bacteroidales bacterium]
MKIVASIRLREMKLKKMGLSRKLSWNLCLLAKYFFVVLIIILMSYYAKSQVKFQKIYSGNSYDYGFSVKQADDEGYFIFGNTSSFGSGNTDIIVIRTDKFGTPIWKKFYGSTGIDYGRFVEKTQDNNFLICGYTNNTADTTYDVLLMKVDTAGNLLWEKHYGGNDWDMGHCVLQSGLNYYIAGETYSYGKKNSNFYLIKTDTDGDTVFTKTYGGDSADVAKSIIECRDGNLLIGGYTKSSGAGGADFYLVKIKKNGDTLWTKTHGDINDNFANSVSLTSDTGISIAGYTIVSGRTNTNYLYIKTDSTGNFQWDFKEYFKTENQNFNYVMECPNGYIGLIGCRANQSAGAEDMMFVVFVNNSGWIDTKLFGDVKRDEGVYAQPTSDSGYVIVGNTESYSTTYSSIFLVKTDKNYNSSATVISVNLGVNENNIENKSFFVYPNPNNGKFGIMLNGNINEKMNIVIYSMQGKMIYSSQENNNAGIKKIDISGFANGLYMINISVGNKIYNYKFIKQ